MIRKVMSMSAVMSACCVMSMAQEGDCRSLRYAPEGDDFVIVNGERRFNRALYGGHTGFRLETGDVPEFALYLPRMGGNFSLSVAVGSDTLFLNNAQRIECRYSAGKRIYAISDPLFQNGTLTITAVACYAEEAAMWKLTTNDMPKGSSLLWRYGGVANKRFSREGDMGVDRSDCFDLLPAYCKDNICRVSEKQPSEFVITSPKNKYGQYEIYGFFPKKARHEISYIDGDKTLPYIKGACVIAQSADYYIKIGLSERADDMASDFEEAVRCGEELSSRIRFTTPDEYINPLGGALAMAADGIWDGTTWLHGAIGWRMPLAGWRAAYAGDLLGWHDRARRHFNAYAASQVTDIEPIYQHPYQDSTLNLARAAKVWGTQMYSNGYICRNPNRNNQMHHYDMNLNYMDELLRHIDWTGDTAYAREILPVIERHLAWEKRNYDPDNDGLYDAYCCIWASDALYYNGGSVTHSSALNYNANKMTAAIARRLGMADKALYYEEEAKRIASAIDSVLWVADKGVWAEYKDLMGLQRLHTSPALWTIYHTIDSRVGTPLQRYQATQYVDKHIPHIPVEGEGVEKGKYATISTSDWQPYIWSINNVAFAEVMHTALAYWKAGRYEKAYNLMKSSVLDGMYMGGSPGNFGQISHYDVARGECYRDFGDPVGVASRMFVEGLYGVIPDRLNGKIVLCPGFPREWNRASLKTPDIEYSFERNGTRDSYKCSLSESFMTDTLLIQVRAYRSELDKVTVNGRSVKWRAMEGAVEYPMIEIPIEAKGKTTFDIVLTWSGEELNVERATRQQHDGYYEYSQGDMSWIMPEEQNVTSERRVSLAEGQFEHVDKARMECVPLTKYFNDSVSNMFKPRYFSPRPPRTTLQIPVQGIGDWCHPKTTFDIDDSILRQSDTLQTTLGVPFLTERSGYNVVFATLWDNFPDKCEVPLTGKAQRIYLMMTGSTNAMQSNIDNAVVVVRYADGTETHLPLVNPTTWIPVEQDYYDDGKAFRVDAVRPYRMHMRTGVIGQILSRELKKQNVSSGHSIDINSIAISDNVIEGGAATMYDIPLDKTKQLQALQVQTLSNDVVVGLLGVTLQR